MKNSINIYSPPSSKLNKDENKIRYVGFWARFIASVVDTIWQMVLIFALGFLVYGSIYFDSKSFKGPLDVFLQIGLPLILVVGFWMIKSATPGKMLIKSKIVDANDFGPVPTTRFIVRYFSYIISTLPFCLGFLWVAFDSKKQGWHDKIAKTVVVYK